MDERLSLIYNACDPLAPATKEYYLDCTNARGGGHFTQSCLSKLAKSRQYERFLFTGHWGCGKSSELKHLHDSLQSTKLFPVFFDADEYLDRYDIEPVDILLALITQVADTLRERLKIELRDSNFHRWIAEFRSLLQSDLSVKQAELGPDFAKVTIQALRKTPKVRKAVREKLAPQMSSLIQEANIVLGEARERLRGRGFEDVVLIVDGLEKAQRVSNLAESEAYLLRLYLEGAPLFTELTAHVVLTVPLALARATGPQLGQAYGVQPYVLPMIKVHQRDRTVRYEPGLACLRGILERRLAGIPIGEAFEPEALDWMLSYSGGHVRQLMQFVREAAAEVDSLPITLAAAKRALAPAVQSFSSAVKHWERLARLDLDPERRIDAADSRDLELLDQESILEYLNGGTDDDPFEAAAPWYAVHPIVRELRPFKDARAALAEAAK
jgi:hypothetical protein